MKIKNIAIIALTTLVVACQGGNDFSIEGKAEGFEDGASVYLNEIGAGSTLEVTDTAKVKDGAFTFKARPLAEKDLGILSFDSQRGNVVFIEENTTIKITVYKDSLDKSVVRGGDENKMFEEYKGNMIAQRNEMQSLQQEGMAAMRDGNNEKVDAIRNEIQSIREATGKHNLDYIKENKDNFVSVLILSELVGQRLITPDEAEEVFASMPQEIKDTKRAKDLAEMMAKIKEQEAASKQASVGNQAPDFSGPTPDGETLALSDAMGKYTIIDFWASWCKPCRAENPNVVKVYNKYHDKGLNIISVSLDRADARDRWLTAIENDKMDWFHVSNLQEWQDPIARAYGVRAIPATFLLDKNGMIIDKDLRGEDLETKMAKLLGAATGDKASS